MFGTKNGLGDSKEPLQILIRRAKGVFNQTGAYRCVEQKHLFKGEVGEFPTKGELSTIAEGASNVVTKESSGVIQVSLVLDLNEVKVVLLLITP